MVFEAFYFDKKATFSFFQIVVEIKGIVSESWLNLKRL